MVSLSLVYNTCCIPVFIYPCLRKRILMFYPCLPVFTHVFTRVYLCLMVFTCVYPCIPMFTCVYPCLLVCIHVYLCLPIFTHVYTHVYLCLPMFTCVYPCLAVFTCVYPCLPMSIHVLTKFTYVHPYSCLPCLPSCTKCSSTGVNKGSVQKLVHKS